MTTSRDSGLSDQDLLAAAVEAAERAAELHREEAGRIDPSEWDEKGAFDFVTEVDREAERRIVDRLRARFPDHRVVAEEGTEDEEGRGPGARDRPGDAGAGAEAAARNGSAGPAGAARERRDAEAFHWLIDPLDGTTNFLHGYPEYAVSIAGIDDAGLRAAVVLNSATGERFEAVRGGGARKDGDPIRVSSVARLDLALVGTGFPFKRMDFLPVYLDMFSRVLRVTSGIRRGGSAALDLCDLACGRLDAFWELWLMPWDVAAGTLIVREAGGVFGALELDREAAWGEGEAAEELREVAAAARRLVSVWGGGREGGPGAGELFRGGAYMGANGELLGEIRRVLSGTPSG